MTYLSGKELDELRRRVEKYLEHPTQKEILEFLTARGQKKTSAMKKLAETLSKMKKDKTGRWRRPPKRWTKAEIEFLKKHSTVNRKILAKMLDRSARSVANKLRQLGLSGKFSVSMYRKRGKTVRAYTRTYHSWTQAEIRILKSNKSAKEIARYLGISVSAVYTKRSRLRRR